MTNDIISRQAVLNLLVRCSVPENGGSLLYQGIKQLPSAERLEVQSSECEYWDDESNFCTLYRLSAKSEPPFKIQDILDYLDTVLYPIISPEHWNVYSELHDMISTLPSAERHGRWINCGWSIKCSVCDYDMPFTVRNYCPNCGSCMDLEENEDE